MARAASLLQPSMLQLRFAAQEVQIALHVQTALQLKPISAKLGQECEMNLKKRSGRLCERIPPLSELSPIMEIREQQRL
ncbi:hypothetical protein [Paenibacillus apis]|nr:hypothetical protein [Paenibacillus apis]